MVETKFGKGVLPDETVDHLKRAINFRGKSAHGHFNPESDAEFRAFSKIDAGDGGALLSLDRPRAADRRSDGPKYCPHRVVGATAMDRPLSGLPIGPLRPFSV